MGPEPFYEKTMSDREILISFLAETKLFKSGVYFAVRWISRFLRPIIFFQMAHQNFKRSLDFRMQKQ